MTAAWVISFELLAISLVQAHSPQCQTELLGEITGSPLHLQPVPLLPPSSIWDITIPDVCINVGLLVRVCDTDGPSPPIVTPLSVHEVIIKRNGYLLQPAVVYATVYCLQSRSNNYDFKTTITAAPRPSSKNTPSATI